MKVIFLFCFGLIAVSLPAHNTITGKVVDRETMGVTSLCIHRNYRQAHWGDLQRQGEFELHVPPELRNDIIAIILLGYKPTRHRLVADLAERCHY